LGTCNDDFGGWGTSAIDAMSIAMLAKEEIIVLEILRFISDLESSHVKGGTSIQRFEVIIGYFGGMVSAYDLLTGPFTQNGVDGHLRQRLHEQMIRLGDMLTYASNTPPGVSRNWLDPVTCATDQGTSNTLAGAGSLIWGFARLLDITGDRTYVELAQKAQSHVLDPSPKENEPFPGLLGGYVQVSDGRFVSAKGGWGSLSDSYYEYLIKAYIYDPKTYTSYLER
jgi:mannosyl-oligosaccharide alpha-1,2-mannosidase